MPPRPKRSQTRAMQTNPNAQRETARICAQPRMRKLFAATLAAGGAMEAARAALGISRAVLEQRLSMLRTQGVARVIAIVDPTAVGRPVQSVSLVRLHHHALGAIVDFETTCVTDPAITTAIRITGRYDYRLTTFHKDVRDAAAWTRALRDQDEVAAVDQRFVRTLFGDEIAGFPLRDDR